MNLYTWITQHTLATLWGFHTNPAAGKLQHIIIQVCHILFWVQTSIQNPLTLCNEEAKSSAQPGKQHSLPSQNTTSPLNTSVHKRHVTKRIYSHIL